MKKGFTLVELSIVLVIIGLLIGGILVGQSLIESAKSNALIAELTSFDVAVNSFEQKYKKPPGDVNRGFANPGDGDGNIEDLWTKQYTHVNSGYFSDEVANFWIHLQQAGFLNNKYASFSNVATAGIRSPANIPSFSKNKEIQYVVYNVGRNDIDKNYYFLCDYSTTANYSYSAGAWPSSSFTPLEGLAIDKKIDDGLAGTLDYYNGTKAPGNVSAFNWTDADRGHDREGNVVASKCLKGNEIDYKTNSSGKECCLLVKMQRDSK